MNEKRYGRRFGKGFLLFLARKAEERKQKLRSVQALLSFLHKKAHREALRNFPMRKLRKIVFLPDKVGHGPLGVLQDAVGCAVMQELGRNMAWLLHCIQAGKAAGIEHPQNPKRPMTNFIR